MYQIAEFQGARNKLTSEVMNHQLVVNSCMFQKKDKKMFK